jgi:CheY-like chemotaxis protein
VYATSGPEAIEAASHRRFDIVLMDLQMPEMDGLEATAILREIPGYETVPILALTANSSDELREQCRLAGMQAFLSKPVDAASLWAGRFALRLVGFKSARPHDSRSGANHK